MSQLLKIHGPWSHAAWVNPALHPSRAERAPYPPALCLSAVVGNVSTTAVLGHRVTVRGVSSHTRSPRERGPVGTGCICLTLPLL